MLYTTLDDIRDAGLCKSGWETLLAYLGKTKGDSEALPVATVLQSSGIADTIWVLAHCIGGRGRTACVTFASDCVDRVMPPGCTRDSQPRAEIDEIRRRAAQAAAQADTARALAAQAAHAYAIYPDAAHAEIVAMRSAEITAARVEAARAFAEATHASVHAKDVAAHATLSSVYASSAAEGRDERKWQERRLMELIEGSQ